MGHCEGLTHLLAPHELRLAPDTRHTDGRRGRILKIGKDRATIETMDGLQAAKKEFSLSCLVKVSGNADASKQCTNEGGGASKRKAEEEAEAAAAAKRAATASDIFGDLEEDFVD